MRGGGDNTPVIHMLHVVAIIKLLPGLGNIVALADLEKRLKSINKDLIHINSTVEEVDEEKEKEKEIAIKKEFVDIITEFVDIITRLDKNILSGVPLDELETRLNNPKTMLSELGTTLSSENIKGMPDNIWTITEEVLNAAANLKSKYTAAVKNKLRNNPETNLLTEWKEWSTAMNQLDIEFYKAKSLGDSLRVMAESDEAAKAEAAAKAVEAAAAAATHKPTKSANSASASSGAGAAAAGGGGGGGGGQGGGTGGGGGEIN